MVPRVLHGLIGPQQHVAIKALALREMLIICRKSIFIARCFHRSGASEKIA
jgi:hypothetical protein